MSDEPTNTEETSEETTEAAETAGLAIDDADQDAAVGGGELIPVSDAGLPKSMSVSQIKDFVLAQIAALAAASGVSVSDDSVYLLKGGALKPVSAATLAAAVLDYGFGLAGIVSPNGNEVFSTLDSGTKKTITLTQLADYLSSHVLIPWGDLTEAANTGALAADDLLVMRDVSAEGDKKVKFATLSSYVCAAFKAYVQSLTGIGASDQTEAVSETDTVYIIHGGMARKATVAQLMAASGVGDVTGPQTTTENNIPQWDETTKKLKNGLALVTTLNAASTNPSDNPPTNSQVPTAAAVRTAIDAAGQAINFVKKTGDETVAGVKTFSSSPLVPNILDGNNAIVTGDNSQKSASTAWVTAKLTAWWNGIKAAAQTISGAWTFSESPTVPTPMTSATNPEVDTADDTTKAANTAWVTAKIAAWWTTVKTEAQAFAALISLNGGAAVPTGKTLTIADAPTNDTDAANKKYVTDNAVFKTGDQTIAGAKTFSDAVLLNGGATVPAGKALTITDTPSADTSAANKLYVDTVVAALRNELVTVGVLSAAE